MSFNKEDKAVLMAAFKMMGLIYRRDVESDKAYRHAYFKLLEGYTPKKILAAMKKVMKSEERYFPVPGLLIKYMEGTSREKALKAWDDFNHSLKDAFSAHIEYGDGLIPLIINRMGGIKKIGSMNIDDIKFLKPDFIERYLELSRSGKKKSIGLLKCPNDTSRKVQIGFDNKEDKKLLELELEAA